MICRIDMIGRKRKAKNLNGSIQPKKKKRIVKASAAKVESEKPTPVDSVVRSGILT